jgi:Fe-S cluster assembly protein SufD
MTTWLQTWLTTRMSLKNKKAALQWILFFGGNLTRKLEFLPFWRKNSSYWTELLLEKAARRPLWYSMLLKLWKSSRLQRNLSDRSTGVFNGKIYVEKEPKKPHSKNNNILLSDKATINAKPQLEIFADDVKCSRLYHRTVRRKRYVLHASTWDPEKKPKLY